MRAQTSPNLLLVLQGANLPQSCYSSFRAQTSPSLAPRLLGHKAPPNLAPRPLGHKPAPVLLLVFQGTNLPQSCSSSFGAQTSPSLAPHPLGPVLTGDKVDFRFCRRFVAIDTVAKVELVCFVAFPFFCCLNVERPFDFVASVYGAKATKSTVSNSTLQPVSTGLYTADSVVKMKADCVFLVDQIMQVITCWLLRFIMLLLACLTQLCRNLKCLELY